MGVVVFAKGSVHSLGVCHVKKLANEPLHPQVDSHASVTACKEAFLQTLLLNRYITFREMPPPDPIEVSTHLLHCLCHLPVGECEINAFGVSLLAEKCRDPMC